MNFVLSSSKPGTSLVELVDMLSSPLSSFAKQGRSSSSLLVLCVPVRLCACVPVCATVCVTVCLRAYVSACEPRAQAADDRGSCACSRRRARAHGRARG
eukprot:3887108-Pleurochrysis_carterae.AAC.1